VVKSVDQYGLAKKSEVITLFGLERPHGRRFDAAIKRVLAHGKFIMGPEVHELEEQLCEYTGARYCVTCASGTDALVMALIAMFGFERPHVLGALTTPFTFTATLEAIVRASHDCIYADVDPRTKNLDCDQTPDQNFHVVVPVDLFGLPADYGAQALAHRRVIADAAQSFGASYHGRKVGVLADATATSFFPTKPLGCFGDGGAVFTNNHRVAEIVVSLREHGRGKQKFWPERVGFNSRLDTIQAAVLLEKLVTVDDEREKRARIATKYNRAFDGLVDIQAYPRDCVSAHALYTIFLPEDVGRQKIIERLKGKGIQTGVYYPIPMHFTEVYHSKKYFPHAERAAECCLSIPCHARMTNEEQDQVINNVCEVLHEQEQVQS
jgi:UDP-2-acetamido-2-deoxy-ribo-hexuluronate aminotransferase